MVLLSFILPIYNTPVNLLKKGIEKLISYNSKDIEIILVDDGSKSEIANICDYYGKVDNRVKVLHQKNQGVSVARNQGIKYAIGKYIIFVDPDDYVLDDIMDITYFKEKSSDVILFDYIRKTNDNKEECIQIKESENELNKLELIKNTLFCINKYNNYYAGAIWAKAFRRNFLNDNNILFDITLRKAQDRVFMLYVYSIANTVDIGNKITYVYYENMESICNAYKPGSSIRSEVFVQAVEKFLKQSDIVDSEASILLAKTYLISYFEMLYLDIFNKDNKNKFCIRRKIAKNKYVQMNISEKIIYLSMDDCIGIGEKIKYFLIKNRCFLLLSILIRYRQKKRS